ncbi:MAG: low-specificity L-threonine aldolase [Spirochaetales bacterium]|nr:low-specificity L-threonine aldolase [Spirochaetales bacterium]
MKTYDLRSDTITKPTEGMRKAMYNAEVGDDVYGEDPTVNKLQEVAAQLTGKEAAIFISSGTMGNLIPIYLNCGRGNELIAHRQAHILHYEMAGLAAIAGAMPVAVDGERGILKPEAVEPVIRPGVYSMPRTKLLEIENTHNLAGGTCYSQADLEGILTVARKHNLAVHMDGARLFNAAAATGLSPDEICNYADTVTFCLSKGLGAPVGSLLCGTSSFVAEARRARKLLGGATRQAGVLAAAGLYALENNVERLTEDHENAALVAKALQGTGWAMLGPVETNIVYFSTPGKNAGQIRDALGKAGVLCNATGPERIRMVTSLEISRADTKEVCSIIAKLAV